MKIILTWAILIGIAASTDGQGAEPKAVEVGGMMTSHRLMREAKDDAGSTSFLGTNYYNLRLQYHMPVGAGWFFSPELDYMPGSLLAPKSPDGNQTSSLTNLKLPAVYNINAAVDVTAGLSLLYYTLKTNG